MSAKSIRSDQIKFNLKRLKNEDGEVYISVNIPVEEKDLKHDFYVHYRIKGEIPWQSSPLIRQSNVIDMHGLEPNQIYQIRIALLSNTTEISTSSLCDNNAFNEKLSPITNFETVSKFADKLLNDVFDYVYYFVTNVFEQ